MDGVYRSQSDVKSLRFNTQDNGYSEVASSVVNEQIDEEEDSDSDIEGDLLIQRCTHYCTESNILHL